MLSGRVIVQPGLEKVNRIGLYGYADDSPRIPRKTGVLPRFRRVKAAPFLKVGRQLVYLVMAEDRSVDAVVLGADVAAAAFADAALHTVFQGGDDLVRRDEDSAAGAHTRLAGRLRPRVATEVDPAHRAFPAVCSDAVVRAGGNDSLPRLCKTFFVATLDEARSLRALLPEAVIYVFAGLMPGTAEIYGASDLRPVLNSAGEIRDWASFCAERGERLPCAVHIDSGMNRLGLSAEEVDEVADSVELWQALTLSLVMSHLACADRPDHPKSETQRALFNQLRARLPAAGEVMGKGAE